MPSSLVHPVSSSIAGYPLLLSAVLCWCVAAGDIRLMPLATVAVSFTAQQHLAVVPATAAITAGALVPAGASRGAARAGGSDPASRRGLRVAAGRSGVIALVLWSPVLLQQAFGDTGNLGQIVWFARHDERANLGLGRALWQAAHALGLPPLLGRTEVSPATWLISRPTAATWVSAAAVLAVVALVCVRWRTEHPRRATLGAMTAVVLAAGLYNGSSVPVGLEQARLSFYHWTFVLAFFVALVIGLAVADAGRAGGARPRGFRRSPATAGGARGPGGGGPRPREPPPRPRHEPAADGRSAPRPRSGRPARRRRARRTRRGRSGPTRWCSRGTRRSFDMYGATLSYALVEEGIDVRYPLTDRFFVHDDHLVDRDDVGAALLFVVDEELASTTPPGELIAQVDLHAGLAVDDYRALVAAAEDADEVDLGDELGAGLSDVSEPSRPSSSMACSTTPRPGCCAPISSSSWPATPPSARPPSIPTGRRGCSTRSRTGRSRGVPAHRRGSACSCSTARRPWPRPRSSRSGEPPTGDRRRRRADQPNRRMCTFSTRPIASHEAMTDEPP